MEKRTFSSFRQSTKADELNVSGYMVMRRTETYDKETGDKMAEAVNEVVSNQDIMDDLDITVAEGSVDVSGMLEGSSIAPHSTRCLQSIHPNPVPAPLFPLPYTVFTSTTTTTTISGPLTLSSYHCFTTTVTAPPTT